MNCVVCDNPLSKYGEVPDVLMMNTWGYHGPAHPGCAYEVAKKELGVQSTHSHPNATTGKG